MEQDFEEYERRQELLEKALQENLRQLEKMAENHEKAGETERAQELRKLLDRLRKNMQMRSR